jgi:hypothetical protein
MSMFRWGRGKVQLFVPPGKQLVVHVTFDSRWENEVRLFPNSDVVETPLKRFDNDKLGGGSWESPANRGTHTLVFVAVPRYREAPPGSDRPWHHFIEERGDVLYEDEHNAVLGFEDGRDADFNDVRLSLHWRVV